MADLAVDAVTKVSDWAIPILIRHGGYVINPQSSISELKEAVHKLTNTKDAVKYKIEDARNSGLGIQTHVLKWVRDVEIFIDKMTALINTTHPTVDCFKGLVKFPSPGERHRLAVQAVEGKAQADAYCEQADKMADVSYHIRHGAGASKINSVFIDLDTHTRLVTKVFEALDGDDNSGIIGIRGIRGIGKSAVVRTIAARATEYGGFHKVKIIAVLPSVDMDNLRSEIVNFLDEEEVNESQKTTTKSSNEKGKDKEPTTGVTTKDPESKTTEPDPKTNNAGAGGTNKDVPKTTPGEPDPKTNAGAGAGAGASGTNKDQETTKHVADNVDKRVLIILDDLLDKIDLGAYIGSKKSLKVQFLVTSTNPQLLSSINCNHIFPLKALGDQEAWKLLTRLVGQDKEAKLGDIKAEELRKRCGGLPVFIEALARIIKRINSDSPWEDALSQLPPDFNSIDKILELTYKQLDDQVKFLYSLCAVLEGQTSQVEHDLLRYSIGMGLFDTGTTTTREAGKRIREGLKNLLSSSLLVGIDKDNQIIIQDARRDIAVKCAFKSYNMHVFDGNKLSNLEIFISHGKDSVPQNHIHDSLVPQNHIHDSLVPQVADKWAKKAFEGRHVLVLRSEEEASIFISHAKARVDAPSPSEMESFFQLAILEKLRILHLENLSFTAGLFPVEHRVIVLKDLVTLCLHNCYVKDMSGIGNLKCLQVLSFFRSVVAKLLKEVGELKKLRSLDFRGCVEVEQIEPGALKGLSSLEELFLGRAFDKWEEDGVPHQRNASLAELNSMRRLATLDVCIPNADKLPKHLAFSALDRYSVYIGELDSSSSQTDAVQDNYNQDVSRTLKLNLESSRVLLDGWFQATMKRAQQLHLEGLKDSKKSIHELCIGGGSGGFEDLKRLEVRNCPSTHYVVRSSEWFARSAFTCLDFLSLDSLMNLEKIGQGLLSPKSFGKLKTVEVTNCEKLKSLFSLSSIHGLSQLYRIKISECDLVQAIIVDERTENEMHVDGVMLLENTPSLTQPDEEEEDDQVSALSFNKSPAVALNKSPANKSPAVALNKSPGPTRTEEAKVLGKSKTPQNSAVASTANKKNDQQTDKVVSPDGKITLHNLHDLIIESSPNFCTFFTKVDEKMTENEWEDKNHSLPAFLFRGDNKICFPKLESLALRNLEKLREIWEATGTPLDLGNLQTLVVEECTNLLSIFHPKLLGKCLQKLESVTIEQCPLIQVVFDLEQLGSESRKGSILPKLREFKLKYLLNLKYIVSDKNPRGLSGFEDLTKLVVFRCPELEYIFTSSIAKAMKKLSHISIEDCAKMKAIVSDEVEDGEQEGSKIEFPALKVLKIDNCPDIGGFSRQRAKQVVPDKDSPSRQIVASKVPKPSVIRYLLCYGNSEEMAPEVKSDLKLAATSEEPMTFFTQKVHLPSLEELELSSAGKFTKIWHSNHQTDESFSKLSSIKVSDCKELVVAFPATILERLEHLRDIEISECPSLRVLFEVQTSTITKRSKPMVFSHLKEVILSSLPKLEHVVKKDTHVLMGFPSLTKIDVSYCDMLIDLMPVATAATLSNLETLTLSSCSKIKEVVGGSGYKENLLDDIVFPLLISLELEDLKSLVHFSSATYQLDFPSLKRLSVDNCMKMKIFSPVPNSERYEFEDALPHNRSLFNERVGLPNLEELVIKNMKKLKELWSIEPFDRSFWHLKSLEVEECNELQNVIPSFMLERLQNLESLIINSCRKVKHIVELSEGIIQFPYLTDLELKMMRRLCSFCSGSKAIKLPLLKHLVVEECHSLDGIAAVKDDGGAGATAEKDDGNAGETATADSNCSKIQIQQPLFWFDDKIAFPNLKELEITDNNKLSFIFFGKVDSLSKLSEVVVKGCDKIGTMFNSNVLQTLTNLESLVVWRCELLEVIYDFCGDGSSDEKLDISAAVTGKLSKLDIYHLPKLSHIWRYDPTAVLNLEKLTSVEIWYCQKLEYIFRASAAKCLFQLEFLDIQNCDLEEIVAGVGGEREIGGETEDAPTFVFPRLNRMQIEDLDNLKSFASGVYTVECPLLSELNIDGCNSLEAFASYSKTFHLQDSPTEKPLFLVHKDSFPHLKELAISNCSNLKRIWQHGSKFTASPFSRLTELEIRRCSGLEGTLFPADTLDIFRNLEVLNIEDCGSLKAIYDVNWRVQNASNSRDKCVAVKCSISELKLRELGLSDLSDLEHVWNGELKGNLSFENLSSVTIDDCQRLEYLFSPGEGLKEISAQDKEAVGAARTPKLLFPRVTSLELSDLPELKSVYPGPNISRWPSLKKMDIPNCTSIAKLRGDFPEKSLEGTSTSTETQPPLFWADKSTFCLLKELTLQWDDKMEQEWSHQFSNRKLFPQLQVLNLKESGESFNSFIHKVQIEKLTITEASCEVLFQCGTVEEEVQGQPKGAHFTELELNDLPELIKIWEDNYEHFSMFEKLKSFQVSECHKLMTLLLPSQVLFSNLASLVISRCNGLKTLMTMPTAKSLTQLSSMKVSECDMLEEILVKKNDGGIIEGVTFPKLKYLELSDLQMLTSFCSGKCKLSFPLLQELVVQECPWIKSFSSSPHDALISTPELKTVRTETGSLLVQGGKLNKALMQFFTDQLACIETVNLSDSPLRQAQWFSPVYPNSFNRVKTLIVADVDQKELPAAVPANKAVLSAVPFDKANRLSSLESLEVRNCIGLSQLFETQRVNSTAGYRKINKMACFKNLQDITISGCNGLKYVLTAAMVLNLTLLRRMRVAECGELVEIVGRQDEVKDRKVLAIEFLKLETLVLESLPKLERFCLLGNRSALKFPSLKRISIKKCDQIKTFTSGFLPKERMAGSTDIGDSSIPQEPFFSDKVLLPILEVLRLIDVHGLNTIWHGGLLDDSIFQLKKVYVRKCPALKYVFPASAANSLRKLNVVEIKECNGLEEIVAKGQSANAAAEKFVFPKVTILRLKKLPGLKCFYPGIFHTSEWPLLIELEVSGCPKFEILASENEYKSVSEVQVDHEIQPLFLIGKDAFPKLGKMTVDDMVSMKKIWDVCEVASKSDGLQVDGSMTITTESENDGISTFKQLEELTLRNLPNLVCFSSTSCALRFSSLNEVEIVGCPEMKFFSDGILHTPEKFECTIELITKADTDEDGDEDNVSSEDEDNDSSEDEESEEEEENEEDDDDDEGEDEDEDEDQDEDDDEEEEEDDEHGDDGSENEKKCLDLNATIREQANQIATEPKREQEKDPDEAAAKDGEDNNDDNDVDNNDDDNEDDPDNEDDDNEDDSDKEDDDASRPRG